MTHSRILHFKTTFRISLRPGDIHDIRDLQMQGLLGILTEITVANATVQHLNSTYCAFVWLLSRMNPHVYEQLVTCVERFVLSAAALPVASEILPTSLVYVLSLYMSHQFVLLLKNLVTVHPLTHMQTLRLGLFLHNLRRFEFCFDTTVVVVGCCWRQL